MNNLNKQPNSTKISFSHSTNSKAHFISVLIIRIRRINHLQYIKKSIQMLPTLIIPEI